MTGQRAERYAAWLDKNRVAVLWLSLLVAVLGVFLASRMSIKSDLTNLLPSSQRSVRDLNAVQKRARPFGTVKIVVESDDPALRARASELLIERVETIGPELVAEFSWDDGALNRYLWDHRFLFADLADLTDGLDALRDRIKRAHLEANPLYVSLEDDPPPDQDRLSDLETKLADARTAAEQPPPWVSADGRLQLLVIQTTFAASDPDRARALTGALRAAIAEVRRDVGPGVRFGLTGNITYAMHEHDSVLQGMTLSLVITVVLCAIGLLLYYRSGLVVLAMLWALAAGVAATFAVAWAMIGHLNVMTAFLFAIVIGNGINAGLILVARYLEEVRAGIDPRDAIGPAIRGAMPGTLAATATAAVAYASLMSTDFRGFRQFGAIAGVGMVMTWLTTFTVLPAALFVLARRGRIKLSRPPGIGAMLTRLLPRRRFGVVLALGGLLTAVAIAISAVYIAKDPFTHDWRDLQSSTAAIRDARALDAKLRAQLDVASVISGSAYQLAIAVDDASQVAPLVESLRAANDARPKEQRWIEAVYSVADLVPEQQPEKLEVLEEIAKELDDRDLQATLSDAERDKIAPLRPPAGLGPIDAEDLPSAIAWPFIERDGSTGRIIVVRGARRFNSFNVDDRLAFAAEVAALELPPGAVIAGESLVVADIVKTMERDAPSMILFALIGSVIAVFLVVGLRRHGLVTIACGLAGVIVMIAACAVAGLRIHFLDLIALPITIGLGIDYSVNLAARDRQDGQRGPHHLLETTGSTVLLCSFTTTVGYGTLMLSANGGIRAFGLAALLGELSCIVLALLVAPAWLAVLRERDTRRANLRSVVIQ